MIDMMSEKIYYYSTNGKADKVTFSEALLKGLAPDKGLYMPDHIPADIRQKHQKLVRQSLMLK